MVYLGNAFSTRMVEDGNFSVSTISASYARMMVKENGGVFDSIVGHDSTAVLFGKILGFTVPAKRQDINLGEGDHLVVGEYVGPRLPEGTTVLPEGATIEWRCVTPLRYGEC